LAATVARTPSIVAWPIRPKAENARYPIDSGNDMASDSMPR
jgi:hypothetical protein